MPSTLLTSPITRESYRQLFPNDGSWMAALRAICDRHGFAAERLSRAPKGSHIVFYVGENLVIKLFAPLWLGF